MTSTRTTPVLLALALALTTVGCSDDPLPVAAPSATSSSPGAPPAGEPPVSAPVPASVPPSSSIPPPERAEITQPVTLSSLEGRATTLTVDQRTVDTLRSFGVRLDPVEPASRSRTESGDTRFSFPVTGGSVTADPAASPRLTGQVEHAGGLRLSALGRDVTIDQLVLDADEQALTAEVAQRRVPLLPLQLDDARLERQDDTLLVTDDAVSFDPAAARRLGRQLGLPSLPKVDLGRLQTALTGS